MAAVLFCLRDAAAGGAALLVLAARPLLPELHAFGGALGPDHSAA